MELEEFVEEIEDITDPVYLERLKFYHEKLQIEDDNFMELLKSKEDVMWVSWEQPWYQKNAVLTRRSVQQIEDTSDTFRTDSFTKEEIDRLEKNWRKFRKRFQVPNTPICLARWRNRTKSKNPNTLEERVRKFVIAFLAQGLQRNLYQVYMRFVAHYGAPVKGSYSKAEEKIMDLCLYHEIPHIVSFLETVLGREQRGLSKRLQAKTIERPITKKMKWTLETATKFLKSLMKHSGKKLMELKNTTFEVEVWKKVEQDMKHQRDYLHRFWYLYLHVQLFVKYEVKLKHLRKKILKKLRDSTYTIWKDVPWSRLVQEFPDGFTHHFLYQAAYQLIATYPKNIPRALLQDVVEFGFGVLKKPRRNSKKKLKTLTLNDNGYLEVVYYSNKLP